MADPYEVLGVARTASQADIKAAYRKLAKKLHPDLNPGEAAVRGKFKEVSAAYDLLSDADKRARFDRGEIDADGPGDAARLLPRIRRRRPGLQVPRRAGRRGHERFRGDLGDILSGMFGGGKRRAGPP